MNKSCSLLLNVSMGVLSIFSSTLISAQANQLDYKWSSLIGIDGTTTIYVECSDIAIGPNDYVYTVGSFSGSIDFDHGPGTVILSSNGYDVFVLKHDTTGNLIWAKNIGGNNKDEGKSIFVDRNDDIYIVGQYRDTVDFDPGNGVFNHVAKGFSDVFLLKLDSSGSYLWSKSVGGNGEDLVNAIHINALGDMAITGSFNGTADFDPGSGISTLSGPPDPLKIVKVPYVLYLDNSGNYKWARNIPYNYPNYGTGTDVTIDNSGNVISVGFFNDRIDLDPGNGTDFKVSQGQADIFIQKLDGNGDYLWGHSIGGQSDDRAYGVACNAYDRIILTGGFRDTVDFDPGINVLNLNATSSSRAFVQKLETNGALLWVKELAGTAQASYSAGSSVSVDSGNNIYTVGFFKNKVDFDPAQGKSVVLGSASMYSAYFHKLDGNGNFKWVNDMTSTMGVNPTSVALSHEGSVYIAGYFNADIDFTPTMPGGSANFTSRCSRDYFLARYYGNSLAGVDEGVGIESKKWNYTDFLTYPNPVNRDLFIAGIDASSYYTYQILDFQGKMISSGRFKESIDVSTLPNGLYLLHLKNGNEIRTGRFVKE